MRQIILDTETTGLDPTAGHRIIEIGGVEMVNRRITGKTWHYYINPEREVEAGALEVHGISNEFLQDKPLFAEVAESFVEFVRGAELIIHNAPFDVGFLNHELALLGNAPLSEYCTVLDTLAMARKRYPGQKNNLDALCKRLGVDNSGRDLHGALLDAQILADVYLCLTGGQVSLLQDEHNRQHDGAQEIRRLASTRPRLRVIAPVETERAAHVARLDTLDKAAGGTCLWRKIETRTENSADLP
jgi:DNA polymerase III subunit epsilon